MMTDESSVRWFYIDWFLACGRVLAGVLGV